jgi:hypothetical protein
VVRVAWTIADLNSTDQPGVSDVLAALAFFQGDHSWLSNYSMSMSYPVPR